jgi:hypothetical protein
MKVFDPAQSLKFIENSTLNFEPVELIDMEYIEALKEKYLQYPGEYSLGLIKENTAFEVGISYDNQVVHSMLWRLAGEFAIDEQEYIGFVADPDYLVGDLEQFTGAEIALVKDAVVIHIFTCLLADKENLSPEKLLNIHNLNWYELTPDPDTGETCISVPATILNLRKDIMGDL